MDINLSEKRKQRLISFLQEIKENLTIDNLKANLNEIEKYILEKKYGLLFEQHTEQVFEDLKTNVPVFEEDDSRLIITEKSQDVNFLLEGDNLHSLYLLQKTHKKKIDVVYIDPPYNTGAKDWKYNNAFVDKNDGYRHSKWLSMMSNRLKYAKNLLKRDGVLICAIDENELATLVLLLEDLFGEGYAIDIVSVVHNPRGVQGDNFSYTNEYALFVYRKGLKVIEDREINDEDIDWRDLRDNGGESLRSDAANCFYPIYVKDNEIIGFGDDITSQTDIHPSKNEIEKQTGVVSIYPIDIQGVERKWRYARQSVEGVKHLLRVKQVKNGLDIELGKNYGSYRTVWTDKKFDANENGTKLINAMVPTNDFDFPKSLYTVYECLNAVIKNKPNAIVLDFFAGSGTTGHAVLQMNRDLGGNRTFILCTNNDIGDKKEKELKNIYPELKNVENLKETTQYKNFEEKYGIARSITYPRIKAAIEGYKHTKDSKTLLFDKKVSKKDLLDLKTFSTNQNTIDSVIEKNKNQFSSVDVVYDEGMIKIWGKSKKTETITGIPSNLRYYKTKMVQKDLEDEELSLILLSYVKEMITLKYSNLIGNNYSIILEEDVLIAIIENVDKYKAIHKIFYAPYILLSSEEENILINNGIEIFKIPEEFFKNELQEVGEIW